MRILLFFVFILSGCASLPVKTEDKSLNYKYHEYYDGIRDGYTSKETTNEISTWLYEIADEVTAQYIPYANILQSYPFLTAEEALKLSGAYLYPENAQRFNVNEEYLKGHGKGKLICLVY